MLISWRVCIEDTQLVSSKSPYVLALSQFASWIFEPKKVTRLTAGTKEDIIRSLLVERGERHLVWIQVHSSTLQEINIWLFPKIGVPQNGWFIMENAIKMDDLGAPVFFGNIHIPLMFVIFEVDDFLVPFPLRWDMLYVTVVPWKGWIFWFVFFLVG